jgi:hypothetical protein
VLNFFKESLIRAIFCKKCQKPVLYIENYYRYTGILNKEGIYTFRGQSALGDVTMPVRKGVDPKPDGQTWSQGRKAAESARGYAPAPRGGSKPVNLSTVRGAGASKPVWRPGYGWQPAYRVGNAGKFVAAANKMAESVGSAFREALRNTNRSAMGPLAGGGGGDPKSQKKR